MAQQFFIGKTQDNYMNIHWNPSIDTSLLIQGDTEKARSVFNAVLDELTDGKMDTLKESVLLPYMAFHDVSESREQFEGLHNLLITRYNLMKEENSQDVSGLVKPVYAFIENVAGIEKTALMKFLVYGKATNIHVVGILKEGLYYDPLYDLMTAQVTAYDDETFAFTSTHADFEDGVLVTSVAA